MIFTDREVRDLHDEVRHRVLQNRRPRRGLQTVLEAYACLPRAPRGTREGVKRMVMRAAGVIVGGGRAAGLHGVRRPVAQKTRDVRSEPMFFLSPTLIGF